MTENLKGINYTVRVSARARRVTLRVAPSEGLVIVIPGTFSRKKIPSIIEEKRSWIERTLARIPPEANVRSCETLPDRYFFPSLQRFLGLEGNDLSTRLRSIAREMIIPWAWSIAGATGLHPASISIRNQKTIWGSCTVRNKISLNQKLLFLEPRLVRYVILHELCHLEHRNHSTAFWSFFEKLDPACKAHRKELRSVQWKIPAWAY